MNLLLYQTTHPNNQLKKGFNATINLSGTLRTECSILNPTIEIETTTNISKYNYAQIPDFNRYYFITDIVAVSNNLWKVSLKCDVLMSYANDIRKLKGNILRQKIEFNLMLADNQLNTYADDRTQCFNFPNSLTPSAGQFNYYLTVVGGGDN